MRAAYAPYSDFPVGAAALVDDGRVVVGCNVENASYGLTLCAECGLVGSLYATGGGQLVALSCVDSHGEPLMPCGRCRQLLSEHGGPGLLIDAYPAPLPMSTLLPHAFGPEHLAPPAEREPVSFVPPRLLRWQGRGTVFVHPDVSGGKRVWTAYWERRGGLGAASGGDDEPGILEEGPTWPAAGEAVTWGRARTPRVVVVDADGALFWAGAGDAPAEIPGVWRP
jgi:cytidine deaminase